MRAALLAAFVLVSGCAGDEDCKKDVAALRARLTAEREAHLAAAQRHARDHAAIDLIRAMRDAEVLARDPRIVEAIATAEAKPAADAIAEQHAMGAIGADPADVLVLDVAGKVVTSSGAAPPLDTPAVAAVRARRLSHAEYVVVPGVGLIRLAVASVVDESGEVLGGVVQWVPLRDGDAAGLAEELGVGVAFVTGKTVHATSDEAARTGLGAETHLSTTVELPRMSGRPLPPDYPAPSVSLLLFADVKTR